MSTPEEIQTAVDHAAADFAQLCEDVRGGAYVPPEGGVEEYMLVTLASIVTVATDQAIMLIADRVYLKQPDELQIGANSFIPKKDRDKK